jgi:hypothetical protein
VVTLEKLYKAPWRWLWQDKGVLVAQQKGESALFLAQAQGAAEPVAEARRLMHHSGPGLGWWSLGAEKHKPTEVWPAEVWAGVHEWDAAQIDGLFWLMAQLQQKVERPVEFWAWVE